MAKKQKIRNMTRDEKITLIDELIERDARIWKQYIRDSEFGLADFLSRVDSTVILRPTQR